MYLLFFLKEFIILIPLHNTCYLDLLTHIVMPNLLARELSSYFFSFLFPLLYMITST